MTTLERKPTWANLGSEAVQNNLIESLQKADLDYDTELVDIYSDFNSEKLLIPGRKATSRTDTGEVFGIVSEKYQICQNRDALDFIQYIDDIELLKVGQAYPGNIFVIAQLPETTLLGDSIRPHMIFSNSHDGGGAIQATTCMLRLVCQNQFAQVFRDSPATVKIAHKGDVKGKLELAHETLIGVNEYMGRFTTHASELVGRKITPHIYNKVLDEIFKTDPNYSDLQNMRISDNRNRFNHIYNNDDNQNFKNTQWGIVNAMGDYITHEEPTRRTDKWEVNRFLWTLGSKTLQDTLHVVEDLAA